MADKRKPLKKKKVVTPLTPEIETEPVKGRPDNMNDGAKTYKTGNLNQDGRTVIKSQNRTSYKR